jgi:uncharacterized membrane protein
MPVIAMILIVCAILVIVPQLIDWRCRTMDSKKDVLFISRFFAVVIVVSAAVEYIAKH